MIGNEAAAEVGLDGPGILARWKAGGHAPGFAGLLGFRIEAFGTGEARLTCPVGPDHANMMGGVHGGVMAGLADAATGCALLSMLGVHERFATTDLQIRYLKAAPVEAVGALTITARIVHKGRRMAVADCEIGTGDTVNARATASMMITQLKR